MYFVTPIIYFIQMKCQTNMSNVMWRDYVTNFSSFGDELCDLIIRKHDRIGE